VWSCTRIPPVLATSYGTAFYRRYGRGAVNEDCMSAGSTQSFETALSAGAA